MGEPLRKVALKWKLLKVRAVAFKSKDRNNELFQIQVREEADSVLFQKLKNKVSSVLQINNQLQGIIQTECNAADNTTRIYLLAQR